jgi:hypothetical protein
MATFLDVTALENFSIVFVFLLAWLGGYAMLLYTKFIQNQFINAILSLLFGFFVILSPIATQIFKTLAPLMAVVMFLVVIVFSASNMFGNINLDTVSNLKWVVLVILVVGLIAVTGSIVREHIDVPERGEDFGKLSTVMFHPNFLGIIFIFALAIFTVALLAARQG